MQATVERLRGYLARIAREYPDIWRQVDGLRAERRRTLPAWPTWCFMPLAGAYAIATGGRDQLPAPERASVGVIGALAAWRVTQGIYQFDSTVMAAVADTPLSGDIPAEVLLALPEWCVYVETPGWRYAGIDSPGFFGYLEHDANDGRAELRIVIDYGRTLEVAMPVHLGGTLVEGLERALAEARRQIAIHGAGRDQEAVLRLTGADIAPELAPRVSAILYLCAQNADLVDPASGRVRPRRPTLTKTKEGMRLFPPDRPTAWEVGWRVGAAIRAAEATERRHAAESGTHASPRPHIRRAHWHSFWVGPKSRDAERKLTLRWLPPIPVNVDTERAVIPTIHRVE